MPTRNTRKLYGADTFYHVYSRGVNKQPVFIDDFDYRYFLSLLKRYLSDKPVFSKSRIQYSWYGNSLELLAYCLMSNHIHLLIYQKDSTAMQRFMQSLMTSYSMYFNKKYKRVGPVFQSRYLANNIDNDNYLQHISRYIHLNPRLWAGYPYSSLSYYLKESSAAWLRPQRILSIFKDSEDYMEFLKDYQEHKLVLDEIKYELAHE